MRLDFFNGRACVSPFDVVDDFGDATRLEMPPGDFTPDCTWFRCCAFYADGLTDPALFERHERMNTQ